METKYMLEYWIDDDGWTEQVSICNLSLIQEAYISHIATYNHVQCRIREIQYVEESRVLAEFQPIDMEEY